MRVRTPYARPFQDTGSPSPLALERAFCGIAAGATAPPQTAFCDLLATARCRRKHTPAHRNWAIVQALVMPIDKSESAAEAVFATRRTRPGEVDRALWSSCACRVPEAPGVPSVQPDVGHTIRGDWSEEAWRMTGGIAAYGSRQRGATPQARVRFPGPRPFRFMQTGPFRFMQTDGPSRPDAARGRRSARISGMIGPCPCPSFARTGCGTPRAA